MSFLPSLWMISVSLIGVRVSIAQLQHHCVLSIVCTAGSFLIQSRGLRCSNGSIDATLLLNLSSSANASADEVVDYAKNALRSDTVSGGRVAAAVGANVTISQLSCTAGCGQASTLQSKLKVLHSSWMFVTLMDHIAKNKRWHIYTAIIYSLIKFLNSFKYSI